MSSLENTKLIMCYNFSGPETHLGDHLDFYTILQKQPLNGIYHVQISGNKGITHGYNAKI